MFRICPDRGRSAQLKPGILADRPPSGMACVLLKHLRTHDDTRRSALYGWAQGPTSVRGRKSEEERIVRKEGWRPAVLGTGGIQEDRMPGASKRFVCRRVPVPLCGSAPVRAIQNTPIG